MRFLNEHLLSCVVFRPCQFTMGGSADENRGVKRSLTIALCLTFSYVHVLICVLYVLRRFMAMEAFGGWIAGSLAMLGTYSSRFGAPS